MIRLKEKLFQIETLYTIIVTGFALLAVACGYFSFWTDSEMWQTVVAGDLFTTQTDYDFSLKPGLNLILFFNFKLAELLNIHPMIGARALFAINGLVSLWLMTRIWKNFKLPNTNSLLLALLLVVSNSFFIKRYAHVRSDLLVTTLLLLATWWATNANWLVRPLAIRVSIFLAHLFIAGSFTPKAIPLFMLWGTAFIFRDLSEFISAFRFIFYFLVGATFLILFYPKPLNFLVDSLFSQTAGPAYFDPIRFEHLFRLLLENPLFTAICIANIFHLRWSGNYKFRRTTIFANLVLIYILVYPDRLPFFLASLIPFLMLPVPQLLETHVPSKWFKKFAVIACVFSIFYWSAFIIARHNCFTQIRYVKWAQNQFNQYRHLNTFDAAGILPSSNVHHWFLGPAERGNSQILQNLKELKMDVIFYVSKLQYVEPELSKTLAAEYISDKSGIFVRRYKMRHSTIQSGYISSFRLMTIVSKHFPNFLRSPNEPIFIIIKSEDGLDISKFARLASPSGQPQSFAGFITVSQIEKFTSLILPPLAYEVQILPAQIFTPHSQTWAELFRFDAEN